MKKLIRTLAKFEPKAFQRLVRYMNDTHSGPDAATLHLFEYLRPHFPHFEKVNFQGYAGEHQGTPLDNSEFRLRCSYLLAKVYQFLAREEMENEPLQVEQALIKALLLLGEYKEADRRLGAAATQLSQHPTLESGNYFHEVHLQELNLELGFSQEMLKSHEAIEYYFDRLDRLYVGMQLKYLLPALSYHRLLQKSFPVARWEYCRERMEKWGDEAHPLAQMSYQLLSLFLGGWQAHYVRLIQLLESHAPKMSATERMNIYGYIQNYLTQRQSQGDTVALREMFHLYQRMDREDLVFGRGDFTEHQVRNMIITGCRLGEIDWARNFLRLNRAKIEDSSRENVFAYVSAFLHFYAGEYSQALKLLQRVQFSAHIYRTGHQTLLLRIYFELDDIQSLEGVAATFRRYLNRSPHLSQRQKDLNRNFISVVQLMAKARDEGLSPYRRKHISEYLEGELGITDRTWLAEKYKELSTKP